MATRTRPYQVVYSYLVTDIGLGGERRAVVSTHGTLQSAEGKVWQLLKIRPDLLLTIEVDGRRITSEATEPGAYIRA